MNAAEIRLKEQLCHLLIATAIVRGDLTSLEDSDLVSDDLSVAISCAVQAAQHLEIQIMNSITSV